MLPLPSEALMSVSNEQQEEHKEHFEQLAPDMGFFSCPHLCIPKFFTMCMAGRTAAPTRIEIFYLTNIILNCIIFIPNASVSRTTHCVPGNHTKCAINEQLKRFSKTKADAVEIDVAFGFLVALKTHFILNYLIIIKISNIHNYTLILRLNLHLRQHTTRYRNNETIKLIISHSHVSCILVINFKRGKQFKLQNVEFTTKNESYKYNLILCKHKNNKNKSYISTKLEHKCIFLRFIKHSVTFDFKQYRGEGGNQTPCSYALSVYFPLIQSPTT
ncbi:hypothetical protein AGLY_010127 [Aphis glycines]|uniref:Uncharacterized protein n=1 Tax=Aphis glycines TaxID=307491 RepID=A0A6G0TFI2_APHGL|nr:hypothetical protein AGLY_010127 [Aphis glycines]